MESDAEMVRFFNIKPCAEVIADRGHDDWDNLPFVEKYRPNSLDDIISHNEIIETGMSP